MPSNFPTRAPVGLIAGTLLAVISVVPILAAWQAVQPPLERFYFGQYVVSGLSATPIGTVAAFFKGSKVHTYRVLAQYGHLLASGSAADPSAPFSVRVVQLPSPAAFHAWLRTHVYGSRDVTDLLRMPLGTWSCAAVSIFGLGAVLDFRRRKRAREGQQLRGGELLSIDDFNHVTKGDGFALYVKN